MLKIILLVALIAAVPSDALLKKLLFKNGSPLPVPKIFSGSNILPNFGTANLISAVVGSSGIGSTGVETEEVEGTEIETIGEELTEDEATDDEASEEEPTDADIIAEVEEPEVEQEVEVEEVRPIFQSYPAPYYFLPTSTYSLGNSYSYPYPYPYPYSQFYSNFQPNYLYGALSTW